MPNNTKKVRVEYFGLDDSPHNMGLIGLWTIPTIPTKQNVEEAVMPENWVGAESLNLMSNQNLPTSGNITLNATDNVGSAKSLVIKSTDTKWSFKVFSIT